MSMSGADMKPAGDPDFAVTVAARPENVATVRHLLGALHYEGGMPERDTDSVRLAVSEALTNAVVHAYADEAGEVTVSAWVDNEQLVVCVADRGRGMTPQIKSPGLGLGLPVMGALTRSLEIRSGAGDEGTEIWMTFDLDEQREDDAA